MHEIGVGDQVTKSPAIPQVFEVIEIDDGSALVAPMDRDAPGAYPHWWPLRLLHRHQ
ncbi:hypothetical protein ABH933_001238 [Nocardia sp. GP40]|uniref:hypothetical protein n=1 Tax=Nocardia sp. GP40 TaxID=3156268 RepID=UPI003D214333